MGKVPRISGRYERFHPSSDLVDVKGGKRKVPMEYNKRVPRELGALKRVSTWTNVVIRLYKKLGIFREQPFTTGVSGWANSGYGFFSESRKGLKLFLI